MRDLETLSFRSVVDEVIQQIFTSSFFVLMRKLHFPEPLMCLAAGLALTYQTRLKTVVCPSEV